MQPHTHTQREREKETCSCWFSQDSTGNAVGFKHTVVRPATEPPRLHLQRGTSQTRVNPSVLTHTERIAAVRDRHTHIAGQEVLVILSIPAEIRLHTGTAHIIQYTLHTTHTHPISSACGSLCLCVCLCETALFTLHWGV